MNNKARSFVTIMLVIAITALLLRIAVEQVIRVSSVQNESNATSTLKLVATALENYSKDHGGNFPANVLDLTKTNPAYIDKDYVTQSPVKGYIFSCPRMDASGYSCYASPTHCGLTGSKIYNVTTGGLSVSEDCSVKKE
jgi:competence protein ComGC